MTNPIRLVRGGARAPRNQQVLPGGRSDQQLPESPTYYTFQIQPGTTALQAEAFVAPKLISHQPYHLIVWALAETTDAKAASVVTDTSPMRGLLNGC